ncbi:MAG: PKD domain-containing protein [Candidatus Nanoarchaeia archaeon]|nr:PKD domain-containing protein [Candidatus Nanoarchaeia archaeon]MDD5741291.1 PKD domain-containing protein [Candidatus Nanoarchaeia archaeon]
MKRGWKFLVLIVLAFGLFASLIGIANAGIAGCEPQTPTCTNACGAIFVSNPGGWFSDVGGCTGGVSEDYYILYSPSDCDTPGTGDCAQSNISGWSECPSYARNGNVPVQASDCNCSGCGGISSIYNLSNEFFSGSPAPPPCPQNQIIMKLYSATNSHCALWNQSYIQDICYSTIFGTSYAGVNPHSCTGTNKIIELYQSTNSHAQTANGPFPYNYDVCYGDLSCEADTTGGNTCTNEGEIVVRLYQNNNSHISNASDTNYPIKICCKSAVTDVYWADMNGNPITTAEIGETVLMISETGGNEFNIKEYDDLIELLIDEDIRTVTNTFNLNGKIAAKWTITQSDFDLGDGLEIEGSEEEFYFMADGKTSEYLVVKKGIYNNAPPTTQIKSPLYKDIYVINKITLETVDIPFEQTSSDSDDDLKLTWEFGDSNITSFNNIIATGLGNTTHSYTTSGTKSIKLTASEMSPPRTPTETQSAYDATEVYVYGKGINVFAIITDPNPDQMQQISGRFVKVNASATHVVNCSYTLSECSASSPSCYVVNDTITKEGIYCYLMAGESTNQNKIDMEWTFDNSPTKLNGKYGTNHSDVVEFIKVFNEPGKHALNLKTKYTT